MYWEVYVLGGICIGVCRIQANLCTVCMCISQTSWFADTSILVLARNL